jgi:hypothetical protein
VLELELPCPDTVAVKLPEVDWVELVEADV